MKPKSLVKFSLLHLFHRSLSLLSSFVEKSSLKSKHTRYSDKRLFSQSKWTILKILSSSPLTSLFRRLRGSVLWSRNPRGTRTTPMLFFERIVVVLESWEWASKDHYAKLTWIELKWIEGNSAHLPSPFASTYEAVPFLEEKSTWFNQLRPSG